MSDDYKVPSIWRMERNEVNVLAMGKMIEEATELAARCARSIIQSLDGVDPESGKRNREELWREVADVRALCHVLCGTLDLDFRRSQIADRIEGKRQTKTEWLVGVAREIYSREGKLTLDDLVDLDFRLGSRPSAEG